MKTTSSSDLCDGLTLICDLAHAAESHDLPLRVLDDFTFMTQEDHSTSVPLDQLHAHRGKDSIVGFGVLLPHNAGGDGKKTGGAVVLEQPSHVG